jgi:hypothetical protein
MELGSIGKKQFAADRILSARICISSAGIAPRSCNENPLPEEKPL